MNKLTSIRKKFQKQLTLDKVIIALGIIIIGILVWK